LEDRYQQSSILHCHHLSARAQGLARRHRWRHPRRCHPRSAGAQLPPPEAHRGLHPQGGREFDQGPQAGEVNQNPASLTLRLLTLPGMVAHLGPERVLTFAGIRIQRMTADSRLVLLPLSRRQSGSTS
jgi:hypothetical protein